MELTPAQRLILINQYETLALLNPKAASDYERRLEILRRGFANKYRELDVGLTEDGTDPEAISFVYEVFDLYDMIRGYKRNHPDDAEVWKHPFAKFQGFGGNEEGEHLSYVKYVLEREHLYGDFLNGPEAPADLNSHFPMRCAYADMLGEWRRRGRAPVAARDDVFAVLEAGRTCTRY